MPQPNFVPVMPSTSRNTQSSGVSPSTSTLCVLPLTLMVKAMAPLSQTSLIATSMLPRVAFEYGQISCASFDQGLGDVALDTRQADVEPSAEEVAVVRQVQVHFGVDRDVSRQSDFLLRAASAIALSKQADQPAANNCSGLVPMRAEPGVESLMSRWPSELRDTPFSRPPVVWVLAV